MFAWQATVQDEFGNAVLLPVVTVYLKNGTTLAGIYTESGDTLPNPLTGTLEGFVQFWAESGTYKILCSDGPNTTAEWSVFIGGPTKSEFSDEVAARIAGDAASVKSATNRLGIGYGALASLPNGYDIGAQGSITAIGYKAMNATTEVKLGIAIGRNAMAESTRSRDCIAIGEDTLRFNVAGNANYDQNDLTGTRNIAIGGNARRFNTTGYNTVSIGRNAGQCQTTQRDGVFIGSNAGAGNGPIGLSGEIENWANPPDVRGEVVAVGTNALLAGVSMFAVAVGTDAMREVKLSRGNCAVGGYALASYEGDKWFNGGTYTSLNISGTYSQTANVLTLNFAAHGMSVGDVAMFKLTSGASATFANDVVNAIVTTVVNSGTFLVAHPISRTTSGTAELKGKAAGSAVPTDGNNTSVGMFASTSLVSGNENTSIGYRAMNDATSGSNNVVAGFRAGSGFTSLSKSTFIGNDAGRFLISGSLASGTSVNRTAIGNNSRTSGDNQVQLGDSDSTTYVYGTVQNRSDARDKADVRDTVLGLEFINALRPVDYRWDMREDYIDTGEDGSPIVTPKDGSKKRNRFHHGIIAQEVRDTCSSLGVEFGGFQDQSVSGGDDILTVGYDELIAPLIKAVQQLSARVAELEELVSK